MTHLYVPLASLAFAGFVRLLIYFMRDTDKPPLPPGPKRLPVLGNLLDIPNAFQWLTFAEWSKIYGDIMYLKIFNTHIIVLNSKEGTTELLERRSANYSDRHPMTMTNRLAGWSWFFGFMPYGDEWRQRRKMFHQELTQAAITKFEHVFTHESLQLLRSIEVAPEDFMHAIRRSFGSAILRIVYGIKLSEQNEEYVHVSEEILDGLAKTGILNTFYVDTLPFLKYVPSWFPGAGFKKKGAYWKSLVPSFVDKPYIEAKFGKSEGVAETVLSRLLDKLDVSKPELDRIAKEVAAAAFAGGADTTVSTTQAFILAMVLYPEAMKKAQAQIDAVVGRQRLPDFGDIASLPYVVAIWKEVLRWHNVVPLTTPHRAMNDDVYKGYFIPKGSIILGNAWLILHDEKTYPNPMEFRPERFLNEDGSLNKNVQDPDSAAFGYGRRICPGRHLASYSSTLTIARILAAFTVTQMYNEDGEPMVKNVETSSGLLCYPLPFKCKIVPRHEGVHKLINEGLENTG